MKLPTWIMLILDHWTKVECTYSFFLTLIDTWVSLFPLKKFHCIIAMCKSFLDLVFTIHKSKFSDSPFFNNISSSLVIIDYCFWQRKGSIWRLGWVFTNLEQGQNRLADLLTHFRPCINTRRYLHTFPNFALLIGLSMLKAKILRKCTELRVQANT